jgi:hypothetical protein
MRFVIIFDPGIETPRRKCTALIVAYMELERERRKRNFLSDLLRQSRKIMVAFLASAKERYRRSELA